MFEKGQRIKAKLKHRGEVVTQGEDAVRDKWRYTVRAVYDDKVTLDDGNPNRRWPAELFVSDEHTGQPES